MKFKATVKCRSTIKKKKEYLFEFDQKDIDIGLKRNPKNQHFALEKQDKILFGLSNYKGKLRAVMYHSYDVFENINGS